MTLSTLAVSELGRRVGARAFSEFRFRSSSDNNDDDDDYSDHASSSWKMHGREGEEGEGGGPGHGHGGAVTNARAKPKKRIQPVLVSGPAVVDTTSRDQEGGDTESATTPTLDAVASARRELAELTRRMDNFLARFAEKDNVAVSVEAAKFAEDLNRVARDFRSVAKLSLIHI